MNFEIESMYSWLNFSHFIIYFAVITVVHFVFWVLFRHFNKGEENLTRVITLRDAALKINKSFMQSEDTQSLLDMMILTAVSLINKGTQGTIMLADNKILRVRAQVGFEASIFDQLHLPLEETMIYKHTGGDLSRAVIIEGDKRWGRDDTYLENIKSMMSAPVFSNGQLFATINLYSSAHRTFSIDDLITLEYLAEQVKDVLEKQSHYEETIKNAQVDSLTGLSNRRHSLSVIERKIQEPGFIPENLCLLLLDIDNLKPVNDHYGHNFGDLLIQGFASALQIVFEDSLCIGRYGGDEFIVCIELKNPLETALSQFEQSLSTYLELHPVKVAALGISIEYSMGAALFSEANLEIKKFIQLADLRMYQRKTSKKNVF